MKDYNNKLYDATRAWLEAKVEEISQMDKEEGDDGKALLQYTGALGALQTLEGRELANRVEVLSRSLSDIASVLRNCEAMDDNNLDSSSLPDYLEHVMEECKGVFALGAICQMAKGLSAVAPDWLIPEDIARGFILEHIEPIMKEQEDARKDKLEHVARYLLAFGFDKEGAVDFIEKKNSDLSHEEIKGIVDKAFSWVADMRPEGADVLPDVIPLDDRNTTLFWCAKSMFHDGMDKAEVKRKILEANKDRCETPLPEREVKNLVEAASMYEC